MKESFDESVTIHIEMCVNAVQRILEEAKNIRYADRVSLQGVQNSLRVVEKVFSDAVYEICAMRKGDIEAIRRNLPEGLCVVPMEPIDQMFRNIEKEVDRPEYGYLISKGYVDQDDCTRIYKAMIAAFEASGTEGE